MQSEHEIGVFRHCFKRLDYRTDTFQYAINWQRFELTRERKKNNQTVENCYKMNASKRTLLPTTKKMHVIEFFDNRSYLFRTNGNQNAIISSVVLFFFSLHWMDFVCVRQCWMIHSMCRYSQSTHLLMR